jgi:clan AA aspartic protease
MLGHVNSRLEPLLPLTLQGENGLAHDLIAVVDTGFTGELSVAEDVLIALGLTDISNGTFVMADGTVTLARIYSATIDWSGQPRRIRINAVSGEPLVGAKLLEGHRLCIDMVADGLVEIVEISH